MKVEARIDHMSTSLVTLLIPLHKMITYSTVLNIMQTVPPPNCHSTLILHIMKTHPYSIKTFSAIKIEFFIRKILIFLVSFAQNIDCEKLSWIPAIQL